MKEALNIPQGRVFHGNILDGIPIPDKSVHCCVTSPPYWGLRDYGVDGQLGLEPTPEAYVENMVKVFREVWSVLRDDGTVWLNLGDSYGNPSAGRNDGNHMADGRPGGMSFKALGTAKHTGNTVKPKDLAGIPWRTAFALQADGWYLRQDIIWHKPNPMPESVKDRCTKAHEYIFLLSKGQRYYCDMASISENFADSRMGNPNGGGQYSVGSGRMDNGALKTGKWNEDGNITGRNKRSVWTCSTRPFSGAHFAVFPPDLIEPCILAGCPEGGTVLDPFLGSGTTAIVANRYDRKFIGVELSETYLNDIAIPRIKAETQQMKLFT